MASLRLYTVWIGVGREASSPRYFWDRTGNSSRRPLRLLHCSDERPRVSAAPRQITLGTRAQRGSGYKRGQETSRYCEVPKGAREVCKKGCELSRASPPIGT